VEGRINVGSSRSHGWGGREKAGNIASLQRGRPCSSRGEGEGILSRGRGGQSCMFRKIELLAISKESVSFGSELQSIMRSSGQEEVGYNNLKRQSGAP